MDSVDDLLTNLIKDIDRKFDDQRRAFEQERLALSKKLEAMGKRVKKTDVEKNALQEELLNLKKRNTKLEKLVVDQNSLIQRMRSKLQVSFENTLDGSTIAASTRLTGPILEHKCVGTDDWTTILEKELAKRIEVFLQAKEDEDVDNSSKRLHQQSLANGLEASLRGSFLQQRLGNASVVGFNAQSDPSTKAAPKKILSHESLRDKGISDRTLSMGVGSAATSIWQTSTPVSKRQLRSDGDNQNADDSLPFENTLRQLPENFDHSALEADLVQRFSELETDALALFGAADFGGSENAVGNVVTSEFGQAGNGITNLSVASTLEGLGNGSHFDLGAGIGADFPDAD